MKEYTLEFLVEKFSADAIKSVEMNEELLKNFLENYPGEPVPESLISDFNLPKAVACICEELLKLKQKDS